MRRIPWLEPGSTDFPPAGFALEEPNGLLAVGGDLSTARLVSAYRQGIFPWYNREDPILWWSPDPRGVLYPDKLKISRSLRKTLKSRRFSVTFDHAFPLVIRACAEPRSYARDTWISGQMIEAYIQLHEQGVAHSVEVWNSEGELVGGLYGLNIGQLYFGESMFSRDTDASKVGFVHLVKQLEMWGCPLVDTQLPNPHLLSLGAETMERSRFLEILATGIEKPLTPHWELQWSVDMLA